MLGFAVVHADACHVTDSLLLIFIYLVLAVLGLGGCVGFSLVVVSGGCSAAEHGLQGALASAVVVPGLWSTGSIVVAHGLGCSMARGIF